MDALEGRDCYAGLDLSSTGDITALVLMFPPRNMDEKYIVLPFFWVPEDTIPRRVKANSVPYDVWEKQGHILATEGNVINTAILEAEAGNIVLKADKGSVTNESGADIIIGTQMISKGFDFPRVSLVCVVDADTSLYLPDFRSTEKTFQLITQVY